MALNTPELERILRKADAVPSLPVMVSRLVQVVTSDESSAKDVAKVVSFDQAFTSKILRLVNSAFYGFPQKIGTVTHATAILGFNVLRSLALSVTVFDMFRGESYGFDRSEFWKHSIGVGVAARELARKARYSEPEEAFIAGLLHDIGKVVLDKFLHDEFIEVLMTVNERGCSMRDAEKEVLGIDHTQLGHRVAEKWNLPPHLRDVIHYHHTPPADLETIAGSAKIVGLVHMGDILTRAKQFGNGGDTTVPEPNQVLWEASGISEDGMKFVLDKIDREFDSAAAFLEMSKQG